MRARVTARCRARSQHVVHVESRGWIGRGRIAEHDDIFVLEGLEGLDVRGAVAARAERFDIVKELDVGARLAHQGEVPAR